MGEVRGEDREMMRLYRRRVAGAYRLVDAEDPKLREATWATPKIDGQLWFALRTEGGVQVATTNGRTLEGEVPLLAELEGTFGERARPGDVLAGELWCATKKGRPRVGGVTAALGSGGDKKALAFSAFDVVRAHDEACPAEWGERYAMMESWLEGGRRAKPVEAVKLGGGESVSEVFARWVEHGKAEGLVVRSESGIIYKVKPRYQMVCAVMGFTVKEEDPRQARSLSLAVRRADGAWQHVGAVGTLGGEEERRAMVEELEALEAASNYRLAASSGAIYRFVEPRYLVEVGCSDVVSLTSDGEPKRTRTFKFEEGVWLGGRPLPGATLLHPVLDGRAKPGAEPTIEQVLDRVYVPKLDDAAEQEELAESEVVRREVYAKKTKGKTAVRKMMVVKTNKEQTGRYPAWMLYSLDFSPARKKPLDRTVVPAPTRAHAEEAAEEWIEDNVKRGWKLVAQ